MNRFGETPTSTKGDPSYHRPLEARPAGVDSPDNAAGARARDRAHRPPPRRGAGGAVRRARPERRAGNRQDSVARLRGEASRGNDGSRGARHRVRGGAAIRGACRPAPARNRADREDPRAAGRRAQGCARARAACCGRSLHGLCGRPEPARRRCRRVAGARAGRRRTMGRSLVDAGRSLRSTPPRRRGNCRVDCASARFGGGPERRARDRPGRPRGRRRIGPAPAVRPGRGLRRRRAHRGERSQPARADRGPVLVDAGPAHRSRAPRRPDPDRRRAGAGFHEAGGRAPGSDAARAGGRRGERVVRLRRDRCCGRARRPRA